MRNSALIIPFIAIFAIFHTLSAKAGGELSNFSPYLALFFCGAAFWNKSKLLLPVALLCTVSTPIITLMIVGGELTWATTLKPLLVPLVAYAVIAYTGKFFTNKKPATMLTGALGCGVFFHIVTNLWCFATSALYNKTFYGLAQALWTTPDLPGAMPTYVFLRNTCASTLLFTALFILAARSPIFHSTKASALSATAEQA